MHTASHHWLAYHGQHIIKTITHDKLEQMRAQGSQCKAREDEEWRYSLIRGEMASTQVLRYEPC